MEDVDGTTDGCPVGRGTTMASELPASTAPELPMPTLPALELELSRRKRPMTDLGCLGLFIPPLVWFGFVGIGDGVFLQWGSYTEWCRFVVVVWCVDNSYRGKTMRGEERKKNRKKLRKNHNEINVEEITKNTHNKWGAILPSVLGYNLVFAPKCS